MSQKIGSFFVVKRKAHETEVRGGKRLRLIGSYSSKPDENDIVNKIGTKNINTKKFVIQDLDSVEFRQFISELPIKKKLKVSDKNEDVDKSFNENRNPFLDLNLSAEDFEFPVKNQLPCQITCNGDAMVLLPPEESKNIAENTHENEKCIYDLYGYHEECSLDFGPVNGNDDDKIYDDEDEDENDENWYGNDYPDEEDLIDASDDDESRSSASDCSSLYQDASDSKFNDFELDDFHKLQLNESEDDMRYGSDSD